MFGFLKSKEPSVPVNDQVWISGEAKFEKCRRLLRKNSNHLFLFWFVESFEKFRSNLGLERNSPNIAYANEISLFDIQGQFPIFCEHYPLRKIEQALFLKLQLKEVTVFSSLDEELFQALGGKNIVDVMKKFRINNEAISHPMINASIRRAQEKLEKKSSSRTKDRFFSKRLVFHESPFVNFTRILLPFGLKALTKQILRK